jgi:hypothetical protein
MYLLYVEKVSYKNGVYMRCEQFYGSIPVQLKDLCFKIIGIV